MSCIITEDNPIIVVNQDGKASSLLVPPPPAYNNSLFSTPSFSSSVSTLNSLQSAQSCPSLEFSHINITQKQSIQIDELQKDLSILTQKCDRQAKQTEQAESQKSDIENEIKDLSQYLFEQVNSMVTDEKDAQKVAEKELIQAQDELDELHEELEKERSRLKELRRMLRSERNTKEEKIELVNQEELVQFKEIIASNASLEYVYRLPFLKQCLATDVTPCLRSGFSRLAVKKMLDSIIYNPCFIEPTASLQHQGTKRLSLVARFRSTTASNCYGCGSKMDKHTEVFRFKLKEQDLEWQYIDRTCRNKLVAVCDFYAFIRHLRSGLQTTRALDSLYEECFQLKLNMFYARSGMDLRR